MSKNYNRCSEENKETNKYGMTDETNENAKTQKKENRFCPPTSGPGKLPMCQSPVCNTFSITYPP